MPAPSSLSASLDGLTVLRFSHAFEGGGGLEQYLDDLNAVLSARHRLHTVQIRLTKGEARRESADWGASRITTYYVPARSYAEAEPDSRIGARLRVQYAFRDWIAYQPLIHRLITRRWLKGRRAPLGICDPTLMLECVRQVLSDHRIDLTVMHTMGDRDCQWVLRELVSRGVPTGMVNHFANDRFLHGSVREQAALANEIGVVGITGLPHYLRNRCRYLGDGIDTDFFQRPLARSVDAKYPGPRVLLPARMVATKGHIDLIRAAEKARHEGVILHLYFAGRCDSAAYGAEVEQAAKSAGLAGQVHVLGPLDRPQLRDWYAACIATALPTHHHEGLGRVTVESQSMEVPVVAYDIGGVREGFVDGQTGFLARLGDIGTLTRGLIRLATRETERRAMGRAGRGFAERHFSFQALAQRHENFLLKLLGKTTLPSP